MTDPPKQKKEPEKHNCWMLVPVKRGASPSSLPRQTLTGEAPPKAGGSTPFILNDNLLIATGLPLSLR